MPQGKPAGVRCAQLDAAERCRLFGHSTRPTFCVGLQPQPAMCGADRLQALDWLERMERLTAPG